MNEDPIRNVETSELGGKQSRVTTIPRWVGPVVVFVIAVAFVAVATKPNQHESARTEPTLTVSTNPEPPTPEATTAVEPADHQEPSLPVCESRTHDVVSSLFAAMETGNADAAADHFAIDEFVAYEEPPLRVGANARNRESLDGYLKQRAEDGSRMSLVTLYFNGGGLDRSRFNVEVHNEDDDSIYGIGAIGCREQKIVRLILTTPDPYIPAAEWATINLLVDRGIEAQRDAADSDDRVALATEANLIADAWLQLAETGGEIGRDAYLCHASSFEQYSIYYLSAESRDASSAQAALALAKDHYVRGSHLLDELRQGVTILPAGSPRSCP